jgi:cell division transport system permease protein
MSTAFIALFLFGLSLLIGRQVNLAIEQITGNVEVTVYLSDPVKETTVATLTNTLTKLDAVADVTYETKAEAWDRFVHLFESQPTVVENTDPDAIPASLRVRLTDPSLYAQITAALGCTTDDKGITTCSAPGIRRVFDARSLLDLLTAITRTLTLSVLAVSILMLASAIALVANTLRMGMFARRKEIGIMRLVGATNWRIRVPFMIEGLVEALFGALAAIVALFLGKVFFIDRLRERITLIPLIRNSDVLWVVPWIVIAAVVIAVVAGTVGMRRFLDV